jgi:hypothetical protein
MSRRYIEINSAFRNRNLYPKQAQFDVILSQTGIKTNSLEALDPVIDAYPFYSFSGFAGGQVSAGTFNGGTFQFPNLSTASSIVDDYYNGYTITDTTIAETRTIINYVGSTQTITPDHPFTRALWSTVDTYTIDDPSAGSSIPAIIHLGPAAFPINEFYTGDIIEDVTIGEFRTITTYDGNTRIATLDSPFSAAWAINDSYKIRRGIPVRQNTLVASTINTATLDAGASTINNYYTGMYIYIPSTGDVRRISSYDGATRIATVAPFFSTSPGAVAYEILQFSRDAFSPIAYNGSTVSQQELSCYQIELIALLLPNSTLKTGLGSRIIYYPYVYVEFSTTESTNTNVIQSNNPNGINALFIAPISDVPIPTTSQFIKIDGNGMVQTIKFKPNSNFKFSVKLPNGELYETLIPDTTSPLPPDPTIQIIAIFQIESL